MTDDQYRAALRARHERLRARDEERRYRVEERMGLLFGTVPASRRRIVVIHQVMKEMESVEI